MIIRPYRGKPPELQRYCCSQGHSVIPTAGNQLRQRIFCMTVRSSFDRPPAQVVVLRDERTTEGLSYIRMALTHVQSPVRRGGATLTREGSPPPVSNTGFRGAR